MNNFRFFFVGAVLLHLLSLFFSDDVGYNCAVVPEIIGAGIAAGGSLINAIAGNSMGRSNARYQAELQKELMQYQWDNYNSPSAQAKALADAGMNPSVAFGQGSNFSSPSASAPSVSPVDIGLSGADLTSSILAMSQAKKVGEEGIAQNLANEITKATFDDQIKQIGLQNKWTSEQTAKVTQEIGLMSATFNEIQQKIENMKSENKLTQKNIDWFDRHMSAEIAHLQSSAEYQKAIAGLTDSQKTLLDSTMEDLKSITNLNMQQLQKVVGLLDKYGDAQAIVGLLSNIVGSATDLIGTFYKPAKVIKQVTE